MKRFFGRSTLRLSRPGLLLGCLAAVPFVFSSCGRTKEPAAPRRPSAQVEAVLGSWMGRYAHRDEGLRVLLSSQEGWAKLRDMELFEAADLFSGGGSETDRIGAARAYLSLADAFASLDSILLTSEAAYLDSLGERATPAERARGGLAKLRLGDVEAARTLFAKSPSPAVRAVWAVGAAGVAAAEGRHAEVSQRLSSARGVATELVSVAGYVWGGVAGQPGGGPFGRASRALGVGDYGGALASLRRLELTRVPRVAGPDLFAYVLMRRACAGLALKQLGDLSAPGAAFLAGLAREHLGDDGAAGALFGKAEAEQKAGTDAVWLFSPCLGSQEAARLASARRGALLARQGREGEAAAAWQRALAPDDAGPLVRATVAQLKASQRAPTPLRNLEREADAAVAESSSLPSLLPTSGGTEDLLPSLYLVRPCAVARAAAEVYRRGGQGRRAIEVLEGVHRKAAGHRPDFVNDVAFLVDLAGAYSGVGDYAPAVAVLFDLSRQYPEARLAYESLKRLYAARTGGETQPRY